MKKTKDVSRNIVARILHNKFKDILLNKKRLTHSVNRIQSKNHKTGTYEINKIALMIKQNNGCDGLALGYQN